MPHDSVSFLLESLGDTPEDVAASLRKLGCRGYSHCPGTCPVARFLLSVGCTDIVVSHIWLVATGPNGQVASHRMPPAVGAFVLRFDDGWYPELVERGEET